VWSDGGVHIVVVGCGRVGSELAMQLSEEGHSVVIIDKNRDAFRRLHRFNGKTLVGSGFDRDVLFQAEARRADALAAVTSGDNTNILTARIARETFQIPNVVARIYDPRRAVIYQRLGIPTVATVTWTTDQVARRLFPDNEVVEWTDPTGEIRLVERALPDQWVGRHIGGLIGGEEHTPVVVTRSGRARLATPELVGQEGDVVTFAVRASAVEELQRRLESGGQL